MISAESLFSKNEDTREISMHNFLLLITVE